MTLVTGAPRPPGWTGKLWAVKQGVGAAGTPDYLWLTDADIAHAPDNLRRLVARAEADQLVLTSLMAKLHCKRWPSVISFRPSCFSSTCCIRFAG